MLPLLFLAACLDGLAVPALSAEAQLVARKTDQGHLEVLEGDQLVLRYNYATVPVPEAWRSGLGDPPAAANQKYAVPRSNYIHPLCGLDGVPLTVDWSTDHPHHRGIYWAWPEVTYQGQLGDLHALQRVWARPTGQVAGRMEGSRAVIIAENEWRWEDATPLVREGVRITVHPRGAHGRHVDLQFSFAALTESVTLARRGTNAYGGLNLRLAPIKEMVLSHHADPETVVPRAAWQFAGGVWEGARTASSLVVFESVKNPGYPGDYVEFPDLPWFQPTFPQSNTRYPLQVGDVLELGYRLWLSSGPPPTEEACRRQWELFQTGGVAPEGL